MTTDRKCETCEWWKGENRKSGLPSRYGHCHGAPPIAMPGIQDGRWPRTPPDEWCGLHKPKGDAPEPKNRPE